ncbi:uncharacterized protein H6S33_010958 [Morchella sextelata]|uniref:uncharacterized protein n=1 Tax=Morchella sextelata TaxID=1174677 RepID=UPI001D05BAD3|nr:uncharacterized protein H6S33_010958 [Morchella sextelata]KAH0611693.1 hypothetical protein H6S33_010958 [Morchella sextelata]
MFENSDSERTATQHPVPFLWTKEIIDTMIQDTKNIRHEMCHNLNKSVLTRDNDSSVLYWGPDLECYNMCLSEQMIKIDRAIKRYKQLLDNKEATHETVDDKNRLVRVWKELRARRRPRATDRVVTDAMGGPDSLEPKYFETQEFTDFADEIGNIRIPRYLR